MRVRYVYAVIAGALAMFSFEVVRQRQEGQYVEAIAAEIVQKAGAEDHRSRVIALRDDPARRKIPVHRRKIAGQEITGEAWLGAFC